MGFRIDLSYFERRTKTHFLVWPTDSIIKDEFGLKSPKTKVKVVLL